MRRIKSSARSVKNSAKLSKEQTSRRTRDWRRRRRLRN